MPLKLVRRHGSPFWYLRGSIRGIRVDESTSVQEQKAAEQIRIQREAELLKRSIHGDTVTRTFAEAALSYMQASGECPLVKATLKYIGRKTLAEVNQALIDDVAAKMFKDGGPATRNRKVYTPISAVMHHAARKQWCPKPVIARPKQPKGRIRSVTHKEAELLIAKAAPHLKPLVLFLFSTGCRLSEALYLDWKDVNLQDAEVTFWETKNGETRIVPLPPQVVATLANIDKKEKAVFRTQKGKAYERRKTEGGGQVKRAWATMCKNAEIDDFTPHDCRHTFATWYLRQNPRDAAGLMKICGWKSVTMVQRYAHLDVDDVKVRIADIWGKSGEQAKSKVRKSKENKVVPLKA